MTVLFEDLLENEIWVESFQTWEAKEVASELSRNEFTSQFSTQFCLEELTVPRLIADWSKNYKENMVLLKHKPVKNGADQKWVVGTTSPETVHTPTFSSSFCPKPQ